MFWPPFFMFFYFEPNFIEKFLWESVFYLFLFLFLLYFLKFWPKSKWREIKIGYLAAILKRYNIFFFRIVIFIVHTYRPMVQISLQKSGGKVVFLEGGGWVGDQREWKYLGHLSVKGVLHPWPILWLFMHLSQNVQHIGDK